MARVRRGRSVLAALAATVGCGVCARPARAQQQPAAGPAVYGDAHAAAVAAHRHALELFDQAKYARALTEFQRAYALDPSFRIRYNIALTYVAEGDAGAALSAFEQYLAEGGREVSSERRAQVRAEMERLRRQLAWLALEVDETGADVTLDGAPLARGPLSRRLRLNAGRHTVSVRSLDGTLKAQTITLARGQEGHLRFEAASSAQVAPLGPARTERLATSAAAPAASGPEVPWLAWGLTGALGTAGAVTGVLALGARAEERDAQARQGVSHQELLSARDKVESFALATDLLLAGTLLAAGGSLYLTLRAPRSSDAGSALLVGPGSLALRGRF